MNRREFIRNSGLSATAMPIFSDQNLLSGLVNEKIKMAIIGVGLRGQNHLSLLLKRDDVEVVAICDVDARMLERSKEIIRESGRSMPEIFTGDNYVWEELLAVKGLQGVIIATPWEWHKPMILGSLKAGLKYVGTEVILGITLEDHWEIVKAAEEYNAHVMMLENVCYRRDVMAVLNMVRQGVFGEVIHLQGGYQHDLREVLFNDGEHAYGHGVKFGDGAFSEARWRTGHAVKRNGDLYPTHGIGPVAQCININRGNRFLTLNSFATKSRGLHKYVVDNGGEDHPNANVRFRLGDVVTTTINCANGETIILQHDVSSPRPYSLGFRVQGTEGLWMDVNDAIYIEGKSNRPHHWDDAKPWINMNTHCGRSMGMMHREQVTEGWIFS